MWPENPFLLWDPSPWHIVDVLCKYLISHWICNSVVPAPFIAVIWNHHINHSNMYQIWLGQPLRYPWEALCCWPCGPTLIYLAVLGSGLLTGSNETRLLKGLRGWDLTTCLRHFYYFSLPSVGCWEEKEVSLRWEGIKWESRCCRATYVNWLLRVWVI